MAARSGLGVEVSRPGVRSPAVVGEGGERVAQSLVARPAETGRSWACPIRRQPAPVHHRQRSRHGAGSGCGSHRFLSAGWRRRSPRRGSRRTRGRSHRLAGSVLGRSRARALRSARTRTSSVCTSGRTTCRLARVLISVVRPAGASKVLQQLRRRLAVVVRLGLQERRQALGAQPARVSGAGIARPEGQGDRTVQIAKQADRAGPEPLELRPLAGWPAPLAHRPGPGGHRSARAAPWSDHCRVPALGSDGRRSAPARITPTVQPDPTGRPKRGTDRAPP